MEERYRLIWKRRDNLDENIMYFDNEFEAYENLDYLNDNLPLEYARVDSGGLMYFTDDQLEELAYVLNKFIIETKQINYDRAFLIDLDFKVRKYLDGKK